MNIWGEGGGDVLGALDLIYSFLLLIFEYADQARERD